MALIGNNVDYTDKDFDSLRQRLINLVQSVFPDWTDFNQANFGNVLLELYAFVGDVTAFYMDRQAAEAFITTATQRKNLIAAAKLLGFVPSTAAAATADVVFTLASALPADVTIPAGSTVRTLSITEPVVFQLLSDLVIPAGSLSGVVTVENSTSQTDLIQSNGLPNQSTVLTATPYLDGSAEITAANGTYTQVDNFLSSTTSDRHFTVVVDQNNRATVRFGNGVNGTVPVGTVTINYKTGGGADGNVNADSLTKIDGTFTDGIGTPAALTVSNPNAASGGADRQGVEAIRTLAPESVRTINRTVAREDYEINSRKLSEVSRALMLTSNELASIPENRGILYIIPQGGGVPSQDLKDEVLVQVTETFPNTLTFQVDVADPVYKTIDVQSTLFLQPGFTAATVRASINTNLAAFFALNNANGTQNTNVDFGFNFKAADGSPAGEFAWADIFNVIRDTAGVRKLDAVDGLLLNGNRLDVTLEINEFPLLGNIVLLNGDTGATL